MKNRQNYRPSICSPFTGKERDRETGYSYFGARYYDSDLSGLFLSVDPMSDKYPGISPYAYCAWNPVKYIDPRGEKIDLSKLTEEQNVLYKNKIEILQKKRFFQVLLFRTRKIKQCISRTNNE